MERILWLLNAWLLFALAGCDYRQERLKRQTAEQCVVSSGVQLLRDDAHRCMCEPFPTETWHDEKSLFAYRVIRWIKCVS